MPLDPQLAGKVALVTGGGTGLGKAIALALARQGANVVIASRTEHPETIDALRACGVRAAFLSADLADERQASDLVRRAVDAMGSLEMLVSNAAVMLHEPIEASTTRSWDLTLRTNVLSAMWLCRSALGYMCQAGSGSIVIVGSTAQFHRAAHQAAYHVSKAALAAFATALAVEAAPYQIRVNLLVPGRFETPANPSAGDRDPRDIPLARAGNAEEIGPAAVFLLSDALASYVTGAELVVSGGLHLRPMSTVEGDPAKQAQAEP